jgi:hypothetical protein
VRSLLALTVLCAAFVAVPAHATVPPTDCGLTTLKGKRYDIKTHLVKCARGKRWARTYLRSGHKPKGWKCKDYSAAVTRFRFIRRRGGRDFLAIRR